MRTVFKSMLDICGFTYAEASVYISEELDRQISPASIKNIARGRSDIKSDILCVLQKYYQQIAQAQQSEAVQDIITRLQSAPSAPVIIDSQLDAVTVKGLAAEILAKGITTPFE